MATIERKRVTLHPLKEDGTVDPKICLYPKTFIDGIVNRDGDLVKVATAEDLEEKADKEELDNYATKEALTEKANDNEVVHLAGNEVISGTKTLADSVRFLGGGHYLDISDNEMSVTSRVGGGGSTTTITSNEIKVSNENRIGESEATLDDICLVFSHNNKATSPVETTYGIHEIRYSTAPETNYILSFPEKSGTIALADDIPTPSGSSENKNIITRLSAYELCGTKDGDLSQVIFTNTTGKTLYIVTDVSISSSPVPKRHLVDNHGNWTTPWDLKRRRKCYKNAVEVVPNEEVTLWKLLGFNQEYLDSINSGITPDTRLHRVAKIEGSKNLSPDYIRNECPKCKWMVGIQTDNVLWSTDHRCTEFDVGFNTSHGKKCIYIIDKGIHMSGNEEIPYTKEVYLALNVKFRNPLLKKYLDNSETAIVDMKIRPGLYIDFLDINFMDVLKHHEWSSDASTNSFLPYIIPDSKEGGHKK